MDHITTKGGTVTVSRADRDDVPDIVALGHERTHDGLTVGL